MYISWSCIPTNDSDGGGVGVGGMELGNGEGSTFDVKKALHSLLSEQEKSKSVNIQIVRELEIIELCKIHGPLIERAKGVHSCHSRFYICSRKFMLHMWAFSVYLRNS